MVWITKSFWESIDSSDLDVLPEQELFWKVVDGGVEALASVPLPL
jgi:hypothetical protein